MTYALPIALVGLFLNLALGVLVLLANPQRLANRQFLVLTIFGSLWLAALACSFSALTEAEFLPWMRAASIVGILVPIGFRLVRLAMLSGEAKMSDLLRQSRWQLGVFAFLSVYCLTDFYVKGAKIRPDGIPDVVHGSLAFLFPLLFLTLTLVEVVQLARVIGKVRGLRRFELQFLLAATGVLFVLGILPSMVIPLVSKDSQIVAFAPLWILMMDGVIAYGIATKRIMNVGAVMRRVISAVLLAVYLCGCYLGVFFLAGKVFGAQSLETALSWPSVLATLAVVLTFGHAQNFLKFFLDRTFARRDEVDPIEGWRQADALTKVTTTSQLLEQFSEVLSRTAGTDRASIIQVHEGTPPSVVVDRLATEKRALSATGLARGKSDRMSQAVIRELATEGWELAFGFYAEDKLRGVVYLAERLSGRIYSETDLRSLELLVTRFSEALENAALYTEVANRDLHNQTLLDNLVSGVLAVDELGKVTRANPEAMRLIGDEVDVLDDLPVKVQELFSAILKTGEEVHNVEVELEVPDDSDQRRAVRAGGAPLVDQDGKRTGALLVIHDISEERRLQSHVRHSDRLATIGKVSASVAHEIKNPLVAIRAFAQLLPERLQDEDFLAKFSSLVDGEVERISATIGGLLNYAGTEQVEFGAVSMHEVIQGSTSLLHAEFRKKRVEVTHDLRAENDMVEGHAGQLKQIFVNLLLNANDAVSARGSIMISSKLIQAGEEERVEIKIVDDGEGIAQSEIRQVLIPFFTTKSGGTGLGLSLTSGLVSQHQGSMKIESEEGQGTTIVLSFPLLNSAKTEILEPLEAVS